MELERIVEFYGAAEVVHDIDLTVAPGESVLFLGPSGRSRSTILRMIAGLEEISDDDFIIDDRRMNRISPKNRDVAMVFQHYALWPHPDVAESIAFGLRIRREPEVGIKTQMAEIASLLGN